MFNQYRYPPFENHHIYSTSSACNPKNFEKNYAAWRKALLPKCSKLPAESKGHSSESSGRGSRFDSGRFSDDVVDCTKILGWDGVNDGTMEAGTSVSYPESSCRPNIATRAIIKGAIAEKTVPVMKASSTKRRIPTNDEFYLIPRDVTVLYGPYFYLGVLDYRKERLHGLESALTFAGANPKLKEYNRINHVAVWYLETEIFQCKLTDLHHGGDGELDVLCFEAAKAFRDHSQRVLSHVQHKYSNKISEIFPSKEAGDEGGENVVERLKAICTETPEEIQKGSTDCKSRESGVVKSRKEYRLPRIPMPGHKKATLSNSMQRQEATISKSEILIREH